MKVQDGAPCHASKETWTPTQFGVRICRIQDTFGKLLGRDGGWCEECQADLETWLMESAEGRHLVAPAKKTKTKKDLVNENKELRHKLETLEEELSKTEEASDLFASAC